MTSASVLKCSLKNIELSDRSLFEKAYKSLKMPLADQDFSMICIWNRLINVRWTTINGNLCVFADFCGRTVLWGPVIGGDKLQETVEECFSILRQINNGAEGRLCYLPEELHDIYSRLKGFKLVHQNQDYVYHTQDLIELKGGKYSKKRHLINHFLSNHKPVVEFFDSSRHSKGCFELLKLWKQQKEECSSVSKDIKFQFKTELELAKETISLADKLNLKGIVVLIDRRIQAMSFGSEVNKDMCSIIVEKTNRNFKGVSEFIFAEFLKRCWSSYMYVNAQEDMDVEYLRAAKLSYHPERLLKSYTLVREQ